MAIEGLNPYIDYSTRTLYNEHGITSADELKRVEGEYAEHYVGTLVDRAGKDMMFQTSDRHILIGHFADIPPTAAPRDHIEFTATTRQGQ